MITLIIFMVLFVPYILTGAKFSRNRYAIQAQKNKIALASFDPQVETANRIRTLKANLNESTNRSDTEGVNHSADCPAHEWGSPGYRRQHCRCKVYGRIAEIRRELVNLEANFVNAPDMDEANVIMPMLLWPTYMMTSYLKSGSVNGYDPIITAQLERELGIKELT